MTSTVAAAGAAAKMLQDEKNAHAAAQNIEPCTNVHCTYSGCVCGRKCGCNIPETKTLWIQQNPKRRSWMSSCDPCQESWERAAQEKENGAGDREIACGNGASAAGVQEQSSPDLVTRLLTCLFPWC